MLIACVALLLYVSNACADEVVTLPLRGSVTQSYLLAPARSSTPKVVAVMFPGGFGQVHLPADGSVPRIGRRGNFLVRSRDLFRDEDLAVAIIDVPSDLQASGLSDGMRMSSEHVGDVGKVVSDLRQRFPGTKIMLVGTSRATLSVAYVARAMGSLIDGVVETSTLFAGNARTTSLGGFDWDSIKVPLLFVHHESDSCWACPYSAAKRLAERYPLITVRGGDPPQSDPCEAMSAHGYIGKEAPTAAAIRNWMLGRPYSHLIE